MNKNSGVERQRMRLQKIRDATINAWWEAKSDQDLGGSTFLFEQIDRLHRATNQEIALLASGWTQGRNGQADDV